jgi:hypothetical protein
MGELRGKEDLPRLSFDDNFLIEDETTEKK